MEINKITEVTVLDDNDNKVSNGDIVVYGTDNDRKDRIAVFGGFNGGLFVFSPVSGEQSYRVKPNSIEYMLKVKDFSLVKSEAR